MYVNATIDTYCNQKDYEWHLMVLSDGLHTWYHLILTSSSVPQAQYFWVNRGIVPHLWLCCLQVALQDK